MSVANNQTEQNTAKCCIDYCEKSYEVAGKHVVNSYKCNSKPLSSTDLWNVQKQRKQAGIKELQTSSMN